MLAGSGFSPVEDLIERGEFAAAYKLIERHENLRRSDPDRYEVVTSELRLELGKCLETVRRLEHVSPRLIEPELVVRAYRCLGRAAYQTGNIQGSRRHFERARSACVTVSELANVEVTFLSTFGGGQTLEATLTSLQRARTLVVRAGSPHLNVRLRLCVARAELSRRCPLEAEKHLKVAKELLIAHPNAWIEGTLWLDWSVVGVYVGDLDLALDCAQKAAAFAERSGRVTTRAGAAINISHILCWRGDLRGAEQQLQIALEMAGENQHIRLHALDSAFNFLVSSGRYEECERLLPQISELSAALRSGRWSFESLSEIFSEARLAYAQRRWTEAAAKFEAGITLALNSGDRLWAGRMRLARARCLARLGRIDEAVADVMAPDNIDSYDPEGMSLYYAALAALYGSDRERSTQHIKRALRVCHGMPNVSLARDLVTGLDEESGAAISLHSPGVGSSVSLDCAAALLNLAGHPHILAREAFALLCEAQCAEAVALLATDIAGTRVVDTCGWDEHDASVVAMRVPEGVEAIRIQGHRGETWQILARPRTELNHRCMLAAARQLISAAADLDRYRRDEKQRGALWPAETLDSDPESIWASEQMAEVLNVAHRIAPTQLSLLLTGETGTGKEMLARAIHRASDRADRVFLPFNCTAVPRDMLESQLFGYRRGAFTGADASFPGVIRSAAGGTLFLDEIADVAIDVQPKLLRFLETHEIHPLGEPHPIKVDVRIVAATNANLEQLVADGRFREDLFYRLNVIRLKLPPLRERREEIPPLVQHYLRKFADEQKKGQLTLADETLEYLLLYSWPGNVRQLANEVRRMAAMADPDSVLTPSLLSPEIQASRRTIPAAAAAAPPEPEIRVRLDQPLPAAVEMLERTMIRRALARSRGRVEEAARLLGISRKGLFLKRRRWNLDQQQAS